MTNEEVVLKIRTVLIDEFEIEEEALDPSAVIIDALEIDSLDLIDLIVIIEQQFGFKVEMQEMAEIKTLQDLYDYIISKIGEK